MAFNLRKIKPFVALSKFSKSVGTAVGDVKSLYGDVSSGNWSAALSDVKGDIGQIKSVAGQTRRFFGESAGQSNEGDFQQPVDEAGFNFEPIGSNKIAIALGSVGAALLLIGLARS